MTRYGDPMRFPDEVTDDVRRRLRRVEGQIRGIERLIDEGADWKDVVTQLSAAQAALHKVGYRLVAAGLQYCASSPDTAAADGMTPEELEKLFLKLG
jgi:DNA-binding FrmR family transcriptional regulator